MPKQNITSDQLTRKFAEVLKGNDGQTKRSLTAVTGDTGAPPRQSFRNPMTTLGDLIVGGVSGALTRLGVGTAGQVLTAQADGSIAWATPSGGSGSGGFYRQFVVVPDGADGFDFIDDGTGQPVYSLEAIE